MSDGIDTSSMYVAMAIVPSDSAENGTRIAKANQQRLASCFRFDALPRRGCQKKVNWPSPQPRTADDPMACLCRSQNDRRVVGFYVVPTQCPLPSVLQYFSRMTSCMSSIVAATVFPATMSSVDGWVAVAERSMSAEIVTR